LAPSLRDAKRALREQVLAMREALAASARQAANKAITATITALPEFAPASVVLAYLSFRSEFDTAEFIDAVRASGKTLLLPRVERERRMLALHRVDDLSDALCAGPFGIREPDPERCPRVAPDAVDFALVPGVAFTPQCARLGYGGGFYDRLIPEFRSSVPLVAAAFAVQIVADLPVSATDRPVDRVVTETDSFVRPPS
jgi:5-formyltetrahydrofolate cyclo-ligase